MARAKTPIAVFNREFKNTEGLLALQKRLDAISPAIIEECKPALERGGDEFVAKIKSIAPVDDDLQSRPGELRDSAHWEPGQHELQIVVVEDARDKDGHLYPAHVEYGHKAPDGTHVEPKPHFWIAYQLTKKRRNSRLNRAINAGIKKGWATK